MNSIKKNHKYSVFIVFPLVNSQSRDKAEFLAFQVYFGLQNAIWKGYFPILPYLYKVLKKIYKDNAQFLEQFPLQLKQLKTKYLLTIAVLHQEFYEKKIPKYEQDFNPKEKLVQKTMAKKFEILSKLIFGLE